MKKFILNQLRNMPKIGIMNPKEAPEIIGQALLRLKPLQFCNGQIYVRLDTHYQCATMDEAKDIICYLLSPDDCVLVSSTKINETLLRIMRHPHLQIDMQSAFKKHQMELNLKNGVYDIQTQRLREKKPDDIFDYVLDFNYKPNSDILAAPNFRKYIQTSVREENQDCLLRSTGYVLSSLTQGKMALLLLGKPSTGKSVYMNFLASAVPAELVTTERFHTMASERAKASYAGKRLNLAREANQQPMKHEDGFKSLISCEDTSGRLLYENTKTIHPHLKFVIGANNDLVFAHPDEAVYNRLVVIRFTQEIPEEQKDIHLEENLIAEKDIILSTAIDTLKDLIASNYDFQMADDAKEYIAHKKLELNSPVEFLKEKAVLTPSGSVSSTELFKTYTYWCMSNDLKPVGRNTFRSYVLGYHSAILSAKVGTPDSQVRGYKGITLKSHTQEVQADENS